MDFHSMKRRELQRLCKSHGIPANLSNAEMATRLSSTFKEIEKEKPLARGRSCLKEVEQDACGLVSDGENRKTKKVRFSPENELIEFSKSIATRGRGRKSVKRNSISSVDNVCSGEVKQAVLKSSRFRVTRSRGLQLLDVGDDENKVTKRGLKSNNRVEEVSSLSDNEVRETTRRSLRKREMQDEELDKNVDNIQGLGMSPRKRTRGSANGIANVPQSKQSKEEPQNAFRRSMRNATVKENTGLVNEDVSKNEKDNVGRHQRIQAPIKVDALVVETDEDLVTAVDKKAGVVTRRSLRNREVMVEGKIVREDVNAGLRSGRHIKQGLLVNNQALPTQDIVEEPKKGFLRITKQNVSQGKNTVPLGGNKNIGKVRSLRNREITVEENTERDDDNAGLRGGRHIKQGLLVNNEAVQSQDIVEEEPKKELRRKSKRNVSQGKDTVTLDGNINNGKVRSLRNRVITMEEKTEREDDNAGLRRRRHIKQGPLVKNEVIQTQDIVEEPKKESLRKSKKNISHEDSAVTLDGHKSIGKVRSLRNREITVEEKTEREDDNAGLRTGRHIKQGPLVNNEVLQTQDIVEEPKKESLRKSKKNISHEGSAVTLDGHKIIGKVRSLRNREITVEEKTEREDDNAGLRTGRHIKQGPLVNNEVLQTQDIVEEPKKESLRKSKTNISHEDNAVTLDGHKSIGKVRSLRNREITVEEKTEKEDDNTGLRSGRHIKQGPLVNNEVLQAQCILEEPKKELLRSKSTVSLVDNTATTGGNKNIGKVRRGRNQIWLALNTSNSKLESAATKAAADSSASTTVSEEVNKTLRRSTRNSAKMDDLEYVHIHIDKSKNDRKEQKTRSQSSLAVEASALHGDMSEMGIADLENKPEKSPTRSKYPNSLMPLLEKAAEEMKASSHGTQFEFESADGSRLEMSIPVEEPGTASPRCSSFGTRLKTETEVESGIEVTVFIEKQTPPARRGTRQISEINLLENVGNVPDVDILKDDRMSQADGLSRSKNKTGVLYINSSTDELLDHSKIGANSEFTSKSSEHDHSVAEDMGTSRRNPSGHNHVNSPDRTERIHSLTVNHAVEKESCDKKHTSVEISSEQLKANAVRDYKSVPPVGNEQDAGNKSPPNSDRLIQLIDEFSLGKNELEGTNHQKSKVSPHKSGHRAGEVEEVNTPHFDTGVESSCSDLADLHIENEVQTMSIPITELQGFEEMGNSTMKVNVENPLDDLVVASFAEQEPSAYFNVDRDSASVEANSRVDRHRSNGQSHPTGGVKEMLREELIKVDCAESESKEEISVENELVLVAAPLNKTDGVNLATKYSLTEDTKSNKNKFLHIGDCSQIKDILNEPVNPESCIHNTAMTGSKLEGSSQQHKLASSPKVDSRKKMEVRSPQLVSAVEESCSEVAPPHFDHVEHEKVIENELKDLSDIANIPLDENTYKSLGGLIGDNLFHCKTYDDVNVARDAGTSEINSPTNAIGCIAQPDLTADVNEGQSEGVAEFQYAGSLSKDKGSTSHDEKTVKDEHELCTIAAESVSSFATVTVSNDHLQDSLDDRPADNPESFIHNTAMTGNEFEESSQQHKLVSPPKVDSRKKMEVQSPQFESAVEEPFSEVVTSHFGHVEDKKVFENELRDLSDIANIRSDANTYKSLEGLIGDNLFHCKTYDDINVAKDAGTSEINSPTNAIGCIAQPDLTANVKEGQSEGVAEFQYAGSLSKDKGSTSQDEQTVKDEQELCTIAAESVSSFATVTVSNDHLQDSLDDRPADNPETFTHNTAMTGNEFEESSQQHKLVFSSKVDSRKKIEVQSPQFESAVEEPCSEVVTSHFGHVEDKKVIENELKDLSDIANIPSDENTYKSLEGLIGDNLFHCKTYDDVNVARDAGTSEINSPTNAIGCIAQPDLTADVKEGQSEGVAEFQYAGSLSKDKGSTSQDEQTVKDEQEPCTIAAESVSSFATVTLSNDLLQDSLESLDDIPADNPENFIHNTAVTGNKFEESSQQPKLASSPNVDSRKKMEVRSPQLVSAVEESCSEVVTSHFDHVEHKKVTENELKDLSYIANIPSEENTCKSLEGLIGDNLFHCKTYDDINVTRDALTSEINSPTNALGCIAQPDLTADVKEGQSEVVAEFQYAGSLSKLNRSTSQDEQTVQDEQELCTIVAESVNSFATVIVSNDLIQDRLDHGPAENLEDGSIRFEDAGLVRSSEKHDYEVFIPEDHAADAGFLENTSVVYLSTTERFSPVIDKEHANDVYWKKSLELGEQSSSISRISIEHAFAEGDRIPKDEDLAGQVNGPDNDGKPLECNATNRRGETILRVTCSNGEEGEEFILPSTTSAASCECIGSSDGLKQVQYVDDTLHPMLALKDGKELRDEVQEKDLHGKADADRDDINNFAEPSRSLDNFPCFLSTPFKEKCEVAEEKDADTAGRENNSENAITNLEVDCSLEASHEVCEEPNIRSEAVLAPWGSFHGDISRELNISTVEKRSEEDYTARSNTSIYPCAEQPDAESATLNSLKLDFSLGGNVEGQKLQVENASTTSTSNYIKKDEDIKGCPTEIDKSAPINELCSKSNKCTSADEDSHGIIATFDHPVTGADTSQPGSCRSVEPGASNSSALYANESSDPSTECRDKAAEMESYISRPTYKRAEDIDPSTECRAKAAEF